MSSASIRPSRASLKAAATLIALAAASAASAQYWQSQSTSTSPYVLPTAAGWSTVSLLTVNDATSIAANGGYKMAGIPDGLGAFLQSGNITTLMNHELGAGSGVTRAHGSIGAFVSQWTIDPTDFSVSGGHDLIGSNGFGAASVATWNTSTSSYNALGTTAFGRFCSADLAPVSAFSNGSLGTTERLFLNGEENGTGGRAFAHIATGPNAGSSYELPALGKFSWENSLANPNSGNKTVVIGTDDSTPGQVYVYIGDKTATGNEVERAGLTNGNLYGIKVSGLAAESRTNALDGTAGNEETATFTLFNHGNVANTSGSTLQANSVANQVTEFLRPEDGVWANDGKTFYFVTTDRFQSPEGNAGQVGASRLYKLVFSDVNDYAAGGQITLLVEGTGSADGQMFDNLTISADGTKLMIQEDPGSNLADDGAAGSGASYRAKIWEYNIGTDTLTEIAAHDASRFSQGGANFMTDDEESSGIIDISALVPGNTSYSYYLLDVQNHTALGLGANASELVENGQLLILTNDPSVGSLAGVIPEPSTYAALVGAAALGFVALRRRRS